MGLSNLPKPEPTSPPPELQEQPDLEWAGAGSPALLAPQRRLTPAIALACVLAQAQLRHRVLLILKALCRESCGLKLKSQSLKFF